MWQDVLEKHFFEKITSISSLYKEIPKQSFQLSPSFHLYQSSFFLEFRYFGLYSPLLQQLLVFLLFFFNLTASSHTIDISSNFKYVNKNLEIFVPSFFCSTSSRSRYHFKNVILGLCRGFICLKNLKKY